MNTINRETDSPKGFDLQKMKAVDLMLDLIEECDSPCLFAAVEYLEDVYLKNATVEHEESTVIELKNYNSNDSFSFTSKEVRNTLVSFIDIWHIQGQGYDRNINFLFYSTTGIAKERKSRITTSENIELYDTPLIEAIISKDFCDKVISCVKKFMLYEYEKQYKNRTGSNFLGIIKDWNNKDWIKFLEQIVWSFRQEDDKSLEKSLLVKISNCKYFSSYLLGQEYRIFASLIELFRKSSRATHFMDRFVSYDSFKGVFTGLEIDFHRFALKATNQQLTLDPYHKIDIPETNDKRNIKEKIRDVCPSFSDEAINLISKKIVYSEIEIDSITQKEGYLSLRHRIYELSENNLYRILRDRKSVNDVSESEVDGWLDSLELFSMIKMEELEKHYDYPSVHQEMIRGIILELFNSCFLDFNKGVFNKKK